MYVTINSKRIEIVDNQLSESEQCETCGADLCDTDGLGHYLVHWKQAGDRHVVVCGACGDVYDITEGTK